MILGPLAGGFVLEHFHWGAVFLISVPVMILVMVTPKILLPEFTNTSIKELDLMSSVLSQSCILAVIYGMTERSFPAIFAGTLFGIAFVLRQRSVRKKLIDFRLFENRTFRMTFTAMFVTAILMGGVSFLVAQFLQLVLGLSPFDAGKWMIPQALGMILGSAISPMIASGIGNKKAIAAGLLISATGMGIISGVQIGNGLLWVETGFVMSVMGAAPILVLGTGMIIGSAAAENAGAAASISETGNQLGVAMGVAILGGLVSHIYRTEIGRNIPAGLSAENWNASCESLAGATVVATKLAGPYGKFLLGEAKSSFILGMRAVTLGSAISFGLLSFITAKKYTT
jgi:DHA2 family multidrug resistance protein-like MFS transporter